MEAKISYMADILKLNPLSYVVVFGATLFNLASGLLEPTIAPYLEVLGASSREIGNILSARWLIVAIFSIPFALLASKIGYVKVLGFSIFSAFIGSIILVYGSGTDAVYFFYIAVGLSAASASGPGAAILAENEGSKRVAAFALFSSTWMIPYAIGAAISAIWFSGTTQYTADQLSSIFPLTMYILGIGGVVYYYFLAYSAKKQDMIHDRVNLPVKTQFSILFAPLIAVSVVLLMTVNFLMGAGAGSSLPFLPPYLKSLGASPTELSLLVLVLNLLMGIATQLSAPLAKRFGNLPVFAVTTALSIVSLLGLVFTDDLNIASLFFILRGTFANMNSPITTSLVLSYIEPTIRATGSAVASNVRWIGWVIFSPISGDIIDNYGYTYSFIFTSILYAIGATLFIFVNLTRPNLEEIKTGMTQQEIADQLLVPTKQYIR